MTTSTRGRSLGPSSRTAASSISNTAASAVTRPLRVALTSAAATPLAKLEPVLLASTVHPDAVSMVVIIFAVVVLPFVPVTMITPRGSCITSFSITAGSMRRATRPGKGGAAATGESTHSPGKPCQGNRAAETDHRGTIPPLPETPPINPGRQRTGCGTTRRTSRRRRAESRDCLPR